jgi:FkbM family methyltransferase
MLIYDVGMHNGDDTAYYLAKGAKVVAIEANAALCDAAAQRFAVEIADGRLTLLNVAVGDRDGFAEFYIEHGNGVRSSLLGRPGKASVTVRVRRLSAIFGEHGLPDFAKIDVEHVDHLVVEELRQSGKLPAQVSVEAHRIDVVDQLIGAGYRSFRLVNCARVARRFASQTITRINGERVVHAFPHHSSGPFGEDLPEPWYSGPTARTLWLRRREFFGGGWFDIHASRDDLTSECSEDLRSSPADPQSSPLPSPLADALRARHPRSIALGPALPNGLLEAIGRVCAGGRPVPRIFGGAPERDKGTGPGRADADPGALRAAGLRIDLAALGDWPAALATRVGLVPWIRLLDRHGVLLLWDTVSADEQVRRRLHDFAAAGDLPLLRGPGGWAVARNIDALTPLLRHPGWTRVRTSLLLRPVRLPVRPLEPEESIDVTKARVDTREWFAIAPARGLFPAPSLQHKRRFPNRVQQVEVAFRRPSLRLPDDKPVFLLGGSQNYYHHLLDFCVRLFGSPGLANADVRFLTCGDSMPFHLPMRDFFGLTGERVAFAPQDGSPVRCERLIIPATPVVLAGEVRLPAALERLRDFAAARVRPADGGERVFISRSMAARRRFADEAPVAEALQARGFAVLHLERMDFAAQVAAFAGARTIVGLHGAGLANMVFSPPGATIVEIMGGDPPHPAFFERLAEGCRHRFLRVPAQGPVNGASLGVDLAAVLAAVDNAISRSLPLELGHSG